MFRDKTLTICNPKEQLTNSHECEWKHGYDEILEGPSGQPHMARNVLVTCEDAHLDSWFLTQKSLFQCHSWHALFPVTVYILFFEYSDSGLHSKFWVFQNVLIWLNICLFLFDWGGQFPVVAGDYWWMFSLLFCPLSHRVRLGASELEWPRPGPLVQSAPSGVHRSILSLRTEHFDNTGLLIETQTLIIEFKLCPGQHAGTNLSMFSWANEKKAKTCHNK